MVDVSEGTDTKGKTKMTTTTDYLTTDCADPESEGVAYRIRWAGGAEETGGCVRALGFSIDVFAVVIVGPRSA